MKRLLALVLVLLLLPVFGAQGESLQKFQHYFFGTFDTIITLIGYTKDAQTFETYAKLTEAEMRRYHQIFDQYNPYEGVNNLYAVNQAAADGPVPAEPELIALLAQIREWHTLYSDVTNPAMGSVLALWHDARTAGVALPKDAALQAAALHTDFDSVEIDESASTVYFTDPLLRLDVGAVAKGWAVQRVAEASPDGMLISVGGNVCATGPKDETGTPWVIGIQNPDGEDYLHTVYLTRGSVVTSGDYQRAFSVNGKTYHHIIDPETLQPSGYWRSVTVICEDSGTADALSTALFVLPLKAGKALLADYGAEAMWVDSEGRIEYSYGFKELIRT